MGIRVCLRQGGSGLMFRPIIWEGLARVLAPMIHPLNDMADGLGKLLN